VKMPKRDISELDANFVSESLAGFNLDFFEIPQAPFVVNGFAWYEQEKVFCRVPQKFLPSLNDKQQELAWHTSGGRIRFRTNSPVIAIDLTLGGEMYRPLISPVGHSGVDMYFGIGNDAVFAGIAKPVQDSLNYRAILAKEMPDQIRDCTIDLPLYNGVTKVRIGLSPGFVIEPSGEFARKRPLVFYGSSITQGGCASRAGNSYTNIVARELNMEIYNFGFSGNAFGEPHIAELLGGIDAEVFILDYDHNASTPAYLNTTHERFYQILRERRPGMPIVIVGRPDFYADKPDNIERQKIIRRTYDNAVAAGDKKVWCIDGSTLFDEEDRDDCTCDRVHPNDLGFYRMAKVIKPVVARAMEMSI